MGPGPSPISMHGVLRSIPLQRERRRAVRAPADSPAIYQLPRWVRSPVTWPRDPPSLLYLLPSQLSARLKTNKTKGGQTACSAVTQKKLATWQHIQEPHSRPHTCTLRALVRGHTDKHELTAYISAPPRERVTESPRSQKPLHGRVHTKGYYYFNIFLLLFRQL